MKLKFDAGSDFLSTVLDVDFREFEAYEIRDPPVRIGFQMREFSVSLILSFCSTDEVHIFACVHIYLPLPACMPLLTFYPHIYPAPPTPTFYTSPFADPHSSTGNNIPSRKPQPPSKHPLHRSGPTSLYRNRD